MTCVDSHDSQNEESSTSGRASILVPIFSEITVNSLKCVRAKFKVLSHRKTTSLYDYNKILFLDLYSPDNEE